MNTSSSAFPRNSLKSLAAFALTLSAHQIAPSSAEAEQVTTASHQKVMECMGSGGGGIYRIFNVDLSSTATVNKTDISLPMTEIGEITADNGLNPDEYSARTFRNYVYGYTEKGWFMYNANNESKNGADLSITIKKYSTYNQSTDDIHLIESSSFEKDRMLIIGPKKIEIYAPFEANGDVKYPEFVNGPATPLNTFVPSSTILSAKVMSNMIYAVEDNGGKKQLTVYKLATDTITKVGTSVPVSDDMDVWTQGKKVFITCGDGKSKVTYLALRENTGDKLSLIDISDPTKSKNLAGVKDIASVDPEGRYQFQSLSSGKTILLDGYTGTTKDILPQTVYPLNGYVSQLPGYTANGKLAFVILDKQKDKMYQIEIINAATLEYKVTETPFGLFSTKYKYEPLTGTGGGDCVNNPLTTGTVTVTGSNPETAEANTDTGGKDIDAGSTDIDAGSTDASETQEVMTGDTTQKDIPVETAETDAAIDTWMTGDSDMQDIFQDTTQIDTNGDGQPDMSAAPDEQETKVETTKEESGSSDITAATENGTGIDTQLSSETQQETADAESKSDTGADTSKPPVINKPPVKDTSCNALPVSQDGPIGTGTLLFLSALAMTATPDRRRRIMEVLKR